MSGPVPGEGEDIKRGCFLDEDRCIRAFSIQNAVREHAGKPYKHTVLASFLIRAQSGVCFEHGVRSVSDLPAALRVQLQNTKKPAAETLSLNLGN